MDTLTSLLRQLQQAELPALDAFAAVDARAVALAAPAAVVLWHLLPWLWDTHGTRSIPGPFIAKFSDIWLGLVAKHGHRSEVVHQLHLQYGPVVRIAPNHISIADPDALSIVYGHGNGALKAPFYDAFVSIRRGVFNTRDRAEHTRKRKIISHIFAQKSVVEFEPHMRVHIAALIRQWDRLTDAALSSLSGIDGEGWRGADGFLWLDCLPWVNYLAFDIIGDLAFGAPFGMIAAARDTAQVPKDLSSGMAAISDKSALSVVESVSIPAVKILNGRGEYSAAMGVLPAYWRPIARQFPWYRRGLADVNSLAGIAIMAVMKRLNSPPVDRVDLLSKLQEGRDSNGDPMGREELTAEALTLLIAGSDTTSNSTCAILYHLARTPRAQHKLQAYLDEHLGEPDPHNTVVTADQVKQLPFLDACINDALRIHSTSSLGLARLVPEGGLHISGRFYPEGAVVSVPSFSIHRDKEVWGEDVEAFRPERWEERDAKAMQTAFNPFSFGPRACVGRNLAMLELQMIIASLLRRYEFVLENPDEELQTSEGFLRKPLSCRVGIRRRDL